VRAYIWEKVDREVRSFPPGAALVDGNDGAAERLVTGGFLAWGSESVHYEEAGVSGGSAVDGERAAGRLKQRGRFGEGAVSADAETRRQAALAQITDEAG